MIQSQETELHATEYGFYDRLTSEFPSQIIVDATEICNLACIHCPHPEFKQSEHYGGYLLETDLNIKMVHEVQEYGQNRTQYIRYTSEGEPLTNPNIYNMLAYAKQYSGVMVTLTTNGTLLTEKRIEQLMETKVDIVDISIDAFTPETYAKIRVNGNLNITQSNVLSLIKRIQSIKSFTKVVVSYVEQPFNTHETKDFESFWNDHGADYVVVRRLHSSAGSHVEIAEQSRQEGASEGRRPCLYPWERIVLNPRGYLAFCPVDWVHGSSIVDYRTTTIHETWQGEFYRNLRQAHLDNAFTKHKFCQQCPDWRTTRWPKQGRSYADMVQDFKEKE